MNDELVFPVDQYTVMEQEINDPLLSGVLKYKEYRTVAYCANPVFPDFQSMNVYVPISFNDQIIDVTEAPILICNYVAGYSPWNARTNGVPTGPGLDPDFKPPGRSGQAGRQRPKAEPGTRENKHDRPFLLYYQLSKGIVVVRPGVRGKSNRFEDGRYFGKAPAALVDLKAVVRYIRHNKGLFPGCTDKIFSDGASAGGALSAALGASGNQKLFDSYLKEIGAAEESDEILGTLCHCPIMDLDHADAAYEWMFGSCPTKDGLVDQEKSRQLASIYADYLRELRLDGRHGFGVLTADNLGEYILKEYMYPAAENYLSKEITAQERETYLHKNEWIHWDGERVSFTFEDFVGQIGRMKGLCTFDGSGEMAVFGDENNNARHFTEFGASQDGGAVDPQVTQIVNMMNPMYHVRNDNPGCSKHWYICVGSRDSNTSHAVSATFITLLENKGMDVSATYMWDYGHRLDDDPAEMVDWIWKVANA